MIISHSHKFIFFHIVKAAGSSVTAALTPYAHLPHLYLINKILRRTHLPINLPGKYQTFFVHEWARRLRKQIPAEQFDNYFKFSFTRNPWDWQVSLYHWYKDHPEHEFYNRVSNMSFRDYVVWHCNGPIMYNQKDYVTDEEGKLLVDFVGKFENMGSDLAYVFDHIGIAATLDPVNVTKSRGGRSYKDYYDDRTKALIAETYERDIDYFGYTFDGVTKPVLTK